MEAILRHQPVQSGALLFPTPTVLALAVVVGSLIVLSTLAYYLPATKPYWLFFYSCFLKPYEKGDMSEGGQQDALESFYRGQAQIYDATRKNLLRGRED